MINLVKTKANGKFALSTKKCEFPDCGVEFEGVGSAKFCPNHRDPESRKIISKLRQQEKMMEPAQLEKDRERQAEYVDYDASNITIDHKDIFPKRVLLRCPCGKEYEVTLMSNTKKYPKYCEEHRNPHRRKMLLRRLGEIE